MESNLPHLKLIRHGYTIKRNDIRVVKIKDFTASEFEKLWKGIERWEGSKEGSVIEVFKIIQTRINKNGVIFSFCIEGDDWITKEQCLELANKGQVELGGCTSRLGNTYLRTPPKGTFQDALDNLLEKKHKE